MKTPNYESIGRERKLTYLCKTPETKRVYIFPDGDCIEVENVIEARASRHGNHQLTTADGTTVVVRDGWLTLTFPTEAKVAPQEVVERGEVLFDGEVDRSPVVDGSDFDAVTLDDELHGRLIKCIRSGDLKSYTAAAYIAGNVASPDMSFDGAETTKPIGYCVRISDGDKAAFAAALNSGMKTAAFVDHKNYLHI